MRRTPFIPLWGWMIYISVKLLPIKLDNWDLFSLKKANFTHDPVTSPESFGGKSHAKTLIDVLHDSRLRR